MIVSSGSESQKEAEKLVEKFNKNKPEIISINARKAKHAWVVNYLKDLGLSHVTIYDDCLNNMILGRNQSVNLWKNRYKVGIAGGIMAVGAFALIFAGGQYYERNRRVRCSDFKTQQEVIQYGKIYGEEKIKHLDRDSDGVMCESLREK